MAEIKAHEFDGALNRIIRDFAVFLVHGPDKGLVNERTRALAAKSGVALDDPFSVVRLEAGDLAQDVARLADETRSMGLFGGKRLVWLRCSGGEKPVIDGVSAVLSEPLADCTLVIEAGDIKKGAGLRKVVEPAKGAVAIPCYADDERSLNVLIDQELAAAGLGISADARQQLLTILGGDRLASRNEIRKLALYALGENRIELHHVDEIVGDASAISTDEAVDAILSGDDAAFVHATQKVIASKTPVFLILQACMRQLQMIDMMRAEMAETGASLQQVMATHGRGLHFKRKPVIERALAHWQAPALASELNRLQSAILSSRQNGALEDSVAMQTLLSTTLQSKRR